MAKTIWILASLFALTAGITDLRSRKIPNWLTYPAMIAGFAAQCVLNGWRGALASIEGLVLFGGFFLLFWLVNAMGAGDVKLAAALGAIVGPAASVQIMLATALGTDVIHGCPPS